MFSVRCVRGGEEDKTPNCFVEGQPPPAKSLTSMLIQVLTFSSSFSFCPFSFVWLTMYSGQDRILSSPPFFLF